MKNTDDATSPITNASATSPDLPVGGTSRPKTILVNGSPHAFGGDAIGGHELARLAFPATPYANADALTVAYDNGPDEAPFGLLPGGRTVQVLEGQTFSVSLTDKS